MKVEELHDDDDDDGYDVLLEELWGFWSRVSHRVTMCKAVMMELLTET